MEKKKSQILFTVKKDGRWEGGSRFVVVLFFPWLLFFSCLQCTECRRSLSEGEDKERENGVLVGF